jgi:hypothetical protein
LAGCSWWDGAISVISALSAGPSNACPALHLFGGLINLFAFFFGHGKGFAGDL